MSSEHDHIRDLLPVVALGACSPDEEAAAEAHARVCPECRAELDALRGTAARLGTAVPALSPSAALKERVMATVHAEAAQRARPAEPSPSPGRRRARRSGWGRSTVRRATAALAAVAVIVSGGILLTRDHSAPVVTAAFNGTADLPAARGSMDYRPDDRSLQVRLNGLPPLKRGDSYQLWVIHPGGKPVSVADLAVDRDGARTARVGDVRPGDTIAVTAQPRTQRAAPQGPLLATGSVPPTSA